MKRETIVEVACVGVLVVLNVSLFFMQTAPTPLSLLIVLFFVVAVHCVLWVLWPRCMNFLGFYFPFLMKSGKTYQIKDEVRMVIRGNKPPLITAERRARLEALAAMPDEDIDYSDAPPATDKMLASMRPWRESGHGRLGRRIRFFWPYPKKKSTKRDRFDGNKTGGEKNDY